MSSVKFIEYIGIATQTLMGDDVENRLLEVMVPELVPAADGIIDATTTPTVADIKVDNKFEGGKRRAVVTTALTIQCEFIGGKTNTSIPNIHLGEQVRVYQLGNSDRYYWAPFGRDDSIRETEHLRFRIANKKDTASELTDDTTYFIEMDSRKGNRKIHIHTSKGTGEKVAYDVRINTDDNTLEIVDSQGNGMKLFSIDPASGVGRWKLWNDQGTYLDLDGPKAVLVAPESVTVESPSINANCNNLVATAAEAAVIKAPTTTIDGNLVIKGNMTTVAGTGGNGVATIANALNVTGHATFLGGVTGDNY